MCIITYRYFMCTAVVSRFNGVQLFVTHGLLLTRLLYPWDSPGKNLGVGCHFLLQGICPTQGWNLRLLRLLHCRWILYC